MSSRNGKDVFARVPCSVTGSGQAEYWSFSFICCMLSSSSQLVSKSSMPLNATCIDVICYRSIFGQSYGGFVALSYLSFAPHGLREVFTTGGLPPIGQTPEQVYRATFRKVRTTIPLTLAC